MPDHEIISAADFESIMRARRVPGGPRHQPVPQDDPGIAARRPNGAPVTDWLSGKNAAVLARQIAQYWAARGHLVRVSVVPIEGHSLCYGITSGMIGGLPPRGA